MKTGAKHNVGLQKVGYCLAIRNNTSMRSGLTRSIRLEENEDLWDRELIFVCYHSLRHLRGGNGAVGRAFPSPQHILLGYLHFLQCRSRSLGSRKPAAFYLQHSPSVQRGRHTAAIISPSCELFRSAPVTRSSCPSFKHLKAEIICALSLLNRCSCKSGTY